MSDEFFQSFNNKKNNKVELELTNTNLTNVKKARIKGIDGKFIYKISDTPKAIGSIASSKMYKTIGVNTPPVKQIITSKGNEKFFTETIQPDVTQIENMEIFLAKDDVEYVKISREVWGKNKWEIFDNIALQERMLKFMTLECLIQLQNIFLVDELRTDTDRTTKNYFLVKSIGALKYEGVIVVDLENMLLFDYCPNGDKDEFKNFISYTYSTATPHQNEDLATYKQRVIDLRDLIQSGNLSESNIKALKKALSFDFAKEVKNESKKRKLRGKNKSVVDTPVERLWEYNNNELGKDLGL